MREADKAGRQKPEAGKSCGMWAFPSWAMGSPQSGPRNDMLRSDMRFR